MEDSGDHLGLLPPSLPGEVPEEEVLSPLLPEVAVIFSTIIMI